MMKKMQIIYIFSNAVKLLNFSVFKDANLLTVYISYSTLETLLKFMNHWSIFFFHAERVYEKEIKRLGIRKAAQSIAIHVKKSKQKR